MTSRLRLLIDHQIKQVPAWWSNDHTLDTNKKFKGDYASEIGYKYIWFFSWSILYNCHQTTEVSSVGMRNSMTNSEILSVGGSKVWSGETFENHLMVFKANIWNFEFSKNNFWFSITKIISCVSKLCIWIRQRSTMIWFSKNFFFTV